MSSGSADLERLRGEIEAALLRRGELDCDALLAKLAKLARGSVEESDDWVFAHRHLAELAVGRDPWRSALFARRVLRVRPDDDGAWALLGLAQSLLGNHAYAARAYEQALRIVPENPFYAHNLGHLYDVALKRPTAAVALLERAVALAGHDPEIVASYAHALARSGNVALAKKVLKRVLRSGATSEHHALWRWLEAGAPSDGELAASRATRSREARSSVEDVEDVETLAPAPPRKRAKRPRAPKV